MPELLTVAEVAARLKVSKMTVYRLCEAAAIGHHRVGRSFRIPEPELEAYLERTRVERTPRHIPTRSSGECSVCFGAWPCPQADELWLEAERARDA